MANWDEKILNAADKISHGIEKGADYVANLRSTNNTDKLLKPEKGNTVDDRTVKHCPSCGHTVGSIDLFCPACGSSLEDKKASSAAQTLAYNLSVIDGQKEGLIRNFVRTHQDKISDKATQKAQMIKAFPVPNNKKDLLEFIHMAASNIDTNILLGNTYGSSLDADALKSEKLLSSTWLEKMESIYQKAQALLAGDPDLAKIQSIYSAKKMEIEGLRQHLAEKNKKSSRKGIIIFVILAIAVAAVVLFGIKGEKEAKIAKNNNLEALVVEIRQDITDGNYDQALLKTNQVRLKDGGSAEEEAKWDRTRETLVKEIESARDGNN